MDVAPWYDDGSVNQLVKNQLAVLFQPGPENSYKLMHLSGLMRKLVYVQKGCDMWRAWEKDASGSTNSVLAAVQKALRTISSLQNNAITVKFTGYTYRGLVFQDDGGEVC